MPISALLESLFFTINCYSSLLTAINRYSLSVPLLRMPGLISNKGSNGKNQTCGKKTSEDVVSTNELVGNFIPSLILGASRRANTKNHPQWMSPSTSQLAVLFPRQVQRESAVWTGNAPPRRPRALKIAILRCRGLRCGGLGLPPKKGAFLFTARGLASLASAQSERLTLPSPQTPLPPLHPPPPLEDRSWDCQ